MKQKNGYRWRYDQNKQNFCFRKVAHLEFTLYFDFWLSHYGNCATFQKNFFLSKAWLWNQQQRPLSPFQNRIDKVSHNLYNGKKNRILCCCFDEGDLIEISTSSSWLSLWHANGSINIQPVNSKTQVADWLRD